MNLIDYLVIYASVLTLAFLYLVVWYFNQRKTILEQQHRLGEYIQLQADDLFKVQEHKVQSEGLRIRCDSVQRLNSALMTENIKLKTKLSHKFQPRLPDGRFASNAVKLNPNAGKYLCVNLGGIYNPTFTVNRPYEKYESKDIPAGRLILIGDDRQRHDVTTYSDYFVLIKPETYVSDTNDNVSHT